MEIKINNKRSIIEIILIAALIFWGVNHLETVKAALRYVMGILSPVIAGCGMAFVLNVPMRALERQFKKTKAIPEKFVRALAVILSLLGIVLVLVFVFAAIIPELINAVSSLNRGIPHLINELNVLLEDAAKRYPEINTYLSELEVNWSGIMESIITFLKSGVSNLVASTWGMATSVIGVFSTLGIGFIIAIYILMRKEILCVQARQIAYAYLPENVVQSLLKIVRLANGTFSSFISSQCLEAVIFGLLTYVSMLIFRFPYARSVSVLIGFMTLIPVLGAFLGTALGAILILIENPIRAVWFVLMIVILQQFDNNLIYPRVVGTSVGLPGMWVLIAVTLGGSLFGVAGMLIFVPLFSVFYQLLGEHVHLQLQKKKISEEKLQVDGQSSAKR